MHGSANWRGSCLSRAGVSGFFAAVLWERRLELILVSCDFLNLLRDARVSGMEPCSVGPYIYFLPLAFEALVLLLFPVNVSLG